MSERRSGAVASGSTPDRRVERAPPTGGVRTAVYEAVTRTPGRGAGAVAGEVGISRSTARYHLRLLEREQSVVGVRLGGRRRYFPVDGAEFERAAALVDPATAAVVRALDDLGSATVTELAEALDRAPSTVSHHLARLAAVGLVERTREGNAVRNRLVASESTGGGDPLDSR